ncbi:MAG: lasso peptide biosynthesis B2 protein [Acidimicrobiales bacterium]
MDASGRTIALHLRSGTYLSLDRSAARIVDLLNDETDPRHAAETLSRRFGVPLEQALGDVGAVAAAVQGLSASRTNRGRRPTVAGVRVVTRSWWRMPARDRLMIVQVTLVLGFLEAGLKTVSVARLARWLRVPLDTGRSLPPLTGPDDLSGLSDAEQRAYWAVSWVLSRWLYDGTCLRRALVLGFFFRRHHPLLRLGMVDEADAMAHAWIEFGGRGFDTQAVTGAFASGSVRGAPDDRLEPSTGVLL